MSRVNREVTSTRVVTLDQIIMLDEFNVRTVETEDDIAKIQALAESIRRDTLISPLTVCEGETAGTYSLISGYRRTKAMHMICESEGIKPSEYQLSVNVKVYQDDTAKELANAIENTAREDVRPADLARRFSSLAAKGLSGAVIAGSCGLSKSYVNNLSRAWDKLPTKITKHWSDPSQPEIPAGELFKWARYDSQDEMIEAYNEWLNPSEDSEEGEEGEGKGKKEGMGPSKKELKAALEKLASKDEQDEPTKAKISVLKWVLGMTKRF